MFSLSFAPVSVSPQLLETICQTLTELLQKLDFPFTKIETVEEANNVLRVNIESERAPFLIGTRGERVDALQHILKNMIRREENMDIFLIVDVDLYKKNREEKVLRIADERADAAKNTGIPQLMPILDSYFRRLVHLYLAENNENVTTESVGEGRDRRLQIALKQK